MAAPVIREGVNTIVFMFVTTLALMSVVSGLHVATRERVATNAALFLRRAVMEAAGEAVPPKAADVLVWYDRQVKVERSADAGEVYKVLAPDGQAVKGYVFIAEGPGLWGRIRAVVGMDGRLEKFRGVTFTEQNETPGLGARIEEPWFRRQFAGKTGPFTAVPEGTKTPDPDKFDAITGATITSRAVQGILNGVQARARKQKAAG